MLAESGQRGSFDYQLETNRRNGSMETAAATATQT